MIDRLLREAPHGRPEKLHFDFSELTFIDPAGVVFFSNLLLWLSAVGTEVFLSGVSRQTRALAFLDDALFFEQHCGRKVHAFAAPRRTTQPLRRIAHSESYSWLELTLTPWLAASLGTTEASLYVLQACPHFTQYRQHLRATLS